MIPNFNYVRPTSLKGAVRQLQSPDARAHAGGTDLLSCLRDQVFGAEKIVSLRKLRELRGIWQTGDGGLRIGALTTITQTAEHPLVRERYPVLAQAAAEVASPQLRNQGTIGGNLCQKPRCWYYRGEFQCLRKGGRICYALHGENQFHCIFGGKGCFIVNPSDTAPALVALDAVVRIIGPNGKRSVAINNFYVGPAKDITRETVLEQGEIITDIILPAPPAGLRSSYRKVRGRQAWDFALAGVALALQFNGSKVTRARVVLSGAAPVPWRSKEVEKVITGRELDGRVIISAGRAAVDKARPLKKNAYKIGLFQGMIEEELEALAKI